MIGLGLCFGLLAFWPSFTLAKVDLLEREKLEFHIVVKYSGSNLQIESMGLRGNGLGLNWESTSPMTQESKGTWTSNIVFRSTRFGYACDACTDPVPNLNTGDTFQFRAVATDQDGQEHVMKGPAYQIPLPMSRVGQHFSEKPVHTLYPFFLEKKGTLTHNSIESENDDVIGQRDIHFYMPPGYSENPKPVYDVIYMFDFGPFMDGIIGPSTEEVAGVFDEAFNEYAADAAIIGFGDYKKEVNVPLQSDRYIITPYPAIWLVCKEGDGPSVDLCNGCLPIEAFQNYTLYNELMAKECGKPYHYGGKLDDVLDYLLDEVHPALSNKIREEKGSVLTQEREHTMINGYSWGGLATCYAAWTRPEIFGRAACQSPSFQEPQTFFNETIDYDFDFINKTLKSHMKNRQRQQILLDVGQEECFTEHCFILRPAIEAADIIRAHKDFEEDVNLWFHVYHGEEHSGDAWVARMWNMLKTFSIGRN